jgi:mRNA-degrading endonuclease RelE of RelBE toxin-antitoxin system
MISMTDSAPIPPIQIVTSPDFKTQTDKLTKRYRNVKTDLKPILDQLLQGETPGDRIKGVQSIVYKVRIKNSNAKKGKSGGYRIIYYLKSQNKILLVTLYSKSDRTDIAIETIVDIIAAYEKQFLPEP